MPKGGRKAKEMKHVGFRMPLDVYHDYLKVAEDRGLDLTVLFLWALNECRPTLLLRHAKHQAELMQAAMADPRQHADEKGVDGEMLDAAKALLSHMEGLAVILRKRTAKGDEASAA
jgi:hypothetical protein